jgi:hypothetical protein
MRQPWAESPWQLRKAHEKLSLSAEATLFPGGKMPPSTAGWKARRYESS